MTRLESTKSAIACQNWRADPQNLHLRSLEPFNQPEETSPAPISNFTALPHITPCIHPCHNLPRPSLAQHPTPFVPLFPKPTLSGKPPFPPRPSHVTSIRPVPARFVMFLRASVQFSMDACAKLLDTE
ncbi:hypothetical protein ACJQWK_02587 [Exserohilum turcicum]